jgi:hypothetical protein
MKHLLNNLSQEEKNSIREQHEGGRSIDTSKFKKLLESTLGNVKPLISEQGDASEPIAAGGGGSEEPKRTKVGGYGVDLTTAKNAPAYQTKYKTSAPTKVDEENIQFTKKLYDGGKFLGVLNYKYNCAKQESVLLPWGVGNKPISGEYEKYWTEKGRLKRGDDQYEVGKMLSAFCALALPDGPYYKDNKLHYTCKDGSGAISTTPC